MEKKISRISLIVLIFLLNFTNTQVIINSNTFFGENMCPFDCYNGGDQGICVDGTCQCNQPYLPPFCAFANSPIISNQTTNGTINTNGYTYYQFEMGSLNQINIQLQITTTAYNGTAALILNNGNAIPDVTNYDYLNQTENGFAELQVEISNEAIYSNNWEIGIYCNTSCNFTVLYVASYVCPNDCSGNGFCSQQTQNCQCYENFILPDCSMQMTAIGTKTNLDFISSTGWNYFNFNITSAGDQLNITVNSLSGNNLQVYVSQYEPPTIYKYNKYFQTMNTNQVIINNPSSSLWYIGIFSISPSNYSLFTDYKLICPNDCNGNGDCGSNGICDCYSPYQDLDCSLYNQTLTEGSPVSGEVINPGSINYYYFPVLQPKTAIYFNIRLQQKVPGKNPKLYLSYNKVPNPYIFDYISFNDGNYERIVVMRDSSQVGIWNCAVYIPSFQNDSIAFTYQIVASTSLYCPNNCSGNGICLDTGICKCNPNYQLEDCSFYLVKYNNSAIIEDMSNQTEWHYYELEVVDINQITVSVTVNYTNTVLYLRYNQLPDLMFYNRRSQVNSSMHDWTLTNETFYSGTWYLGIHKPKGIPVNYIVSFSNNSVCVNNCTSPQHGKCINNKCVCNENFVLNDCSAPNFPIFSGQAVNGEISSEEWNFYYISVQGENALIITLEELNTSYLGNIWVYVEENNYPSTKNFAFSNTDISKIHTIYINSSIAGGGKNWIIGVFGSPKMGYNLQSVRYNISADTGCNGYGVCSLCVEDPNCGWCHSDPLNSTVGSCYGGTSNGPSHQECKFVWSFSTCSTKSTRDKNLLVGLYTGVAVGVFLFLVLVFLFITAYRINKNKKKFHYKRISALN